VREGIDAFSRGDVETMVERSDPEIEIFLGHQEGVAVEAAQRAD
jgi:hypothetical protein